MICSNNINPDRRIKSVGVIFVYCRAIMLFRTVEDAGPYKEKSNFLMRSTLWVSFFAFTDEFVYIY